MANKKEFTIKINGLEDAVKSTTTLSEVLEKLNKEGKSLKDLNINISGNAEQKGKEIKETIDTIKQTKLTVNVGGVSQEFNNIKQALKAIKDEMINLELVGDENTETYRELAQVYQDLALRADDANQAVGLLVTHAPELQNMLSIFKGFTSLASVGQGISNLLGIDNDEVQESINKMTSLIGVLEGISRLQEEINSASAFAKLFQSINDGITLVNSRVVSGVKNIGSYISNLLRLKTTSTAAAVGLAAAGTAGLEASTGLAAAGEGAKAGAVGINLMKTAARTFWLFALIEAIMKLVEWLGKGIKIIYQWISGANDAAKPLDMLKNKMEVLASSTERFNRIIDSMQARGLITSLDAINLKVQKTNKNIDSLLKDIEKLNKKNSIKPSSIDFSNWDKIENKYKNLQDKVIDGETSAQNKLVQLQESIIDEYVKRYNAVDRKSEESIREFQKWISEAEALNSSLANIDKLFGDRKNPEQYRELIKSLTTEFSNLSQGVDDATNSIKEIQQRTIDNNIAAMKDGYAKSIKEIENNKKKELERLGYYGKEEKELSISQAAEKLSIEEKYQRQIADLNTQFGNELYQIQKRIRDNNLYAEKRGYELRLIQLKNTMFDELREAQRSGKLVKEQELSIRKKYNQMIEDEEKKHQDSIQKLTEEQYRRKLNQQISDTTTYIQNETNLVEQFFDKLSSVDKIESLDEEINKFKSDVEDLQSLKDVKLFDDNFFDDLEYNLKELDKNFRSVQTRLEQGFEYNPSKQLQLVEELYAKHYKNLENRRDSMTNTEYKSEKEKLDKDYNLLQNELIRQLDMEQQYANQEVKLNEAKYKVIKILQERAFNNEQNSLINQEEQRYQDSIRSYKEQYEQGAILKDEYDKLIENEEDIHQYRLYTIQEQMNQKRLILEQDYNQKLISDRQKSVNAQIKAFSDLQNAIQEKLNNITIIPNNDLMRFLEIGNIVQYKKAWEDAANNIKVAIDKIDLELAQLSKDSVRNKDLIQYLQQMKKQLQKQLKGMGIKDMWLSIYKESLNAYKSIADAFVGQLSSVLNTLNETALQLIDNQLTHIEQELEIQQEAYDRAEECAQKHKDKMNSIEDELSESRGARREQLISNLMEQEKAYLEDLSAQQHAAQEKEKIEKQQEILEKKRKEQEKKGKIQQAIINTYTAVSNALAVQPWFLGLALSAVALGLGIRNVAAIKATPIYKDGGIIQGKRHSQGGVKVLGGQAEVEGGEYITNRVSTMKNLPLLTYVNSQKKQLTRDDLNRFFDNNPNKPSKAIRNVRRFAEGGELPQMNSDYLQKQVQQIIVEQDTRPVQVQVVDIINAQEDLKRVQVLSGLHN